MKLEKFKNLLAHKTQIQQSETTALGSIVDEFPYFQTARALYLKGLKNQDSFKYNNELKSTAAQTTDRTVLFDFITSKEFYTKAKDLHQKNEEKTSEIIPTELISENISLTSKEKLAVNIEEAIADNENVLNIGKPIPFSTSENYSFNQWLQLGAKKPIIRTEKVSVKTDKKEVIIETFIKNNPKIEPLPKGKDLSVTITKNKQDASLMTETLAKVYLEQKKYENAIQAYRILSLKYPEKSGFFADQIKRIQILQKHK